ncbi:hypothetical protein ECG_04468 [Echinococcus granulosus]|nr:hypothetical protein ECG_04468 [Echinococcus granulosus]
MYIRSVFTGFLRHSSLYWLASLPAPLRNISTSTVFLSSDPSFKHILQRNDLPEDVKMKIESEAKDMFKDWIPYGWNDYDKIDDTSKYKTAAFLLMVCFTFGLAFQFWYRPRGIEGDWARREAFLELERRRKLGLPLVDPNLIPPERVKLPPKEQLGPDFKIIL